MTKEEILKLIEVVNNIKRTAPILLIGEARTTFRAIYKGRIIEVTKDNVRDIVEDYTTRVLSYPLVLDNISNLSNKQVNLILKLIEESKNPIILLASFDNINSILLSRIKTYIKYKEKVTTELKDSGDVLEILDDRIDKDTSYEDKMRIIFEVSPIYYLYKEQYKRDDYLNILL